MSDQAGKAEWVKRVLGFDVATPGLQSDPETSSDAAQLKQRLQSAGAALRGLRDAKAPEAADLLARYAKLTSSAESAPGDVAAALDALERDLALATSAARARGAVPPTARGVEFRKLLLRWREAQGMFGANLQSLGQTLLARDDIKADSRLAQIKQAVDDLPKLVPIFGGELETTLNDGMNAAVPAEVERLAADSVTAIDAYRGKLADAAHLLKLEIFAAQDLGSTLPLHSALDEALVELRQQLAA